MRSPREVILYLGRHASLAMSSAIITLFGTPETLEKLSVRVLVHGIQNVVEDRDSDANDEDFFRLDSNHRHNFDGVKNMNARMVDSERYSTINEVRKWLENNILSNNNVRQLLWRGAQAEVAAGCLDSMFSLLLGPGLRELDLATEAGAGHTLGVGDTVPTVNSANMLREIRGMVDNGARMLTKKLHFQGYDEYCPVNTTLIQEQFFNRSGNMFASNSWQKLTDLSLINFDWSWCSFNSWPADKRREYRVDALGFFQAIGQNLPSLTQLELTHPQCLRVAGYLWLLLDSPLTAFPELAGDEESSCYQPGFITGEPDMVHWCSDNVLSRNVNTNPICERLEHLKIYDLSEQLPLLAAMLRWCGQLRTLDLPEIVFYSEAGDGDGEFEFEAELYRKNFLLACLHLLRRHGSPSTNIRRLIIEDAGSRRMDQVWRHFGMRTPAEDPLTAILDTVRRVASNVQDLYLGNSAQNCYEDEEAGELPPLRLEPRQLEAVAALRNLATLELEAAAADTVEAVLLRLAEAGSRLAAVTLTNIAVDVGRVLELVCGRGLAVTSLHLRNTRVVLSDEEDHTRQLDWSQPRLARSRPPLSRLAVDYTVPLELVEWAVTQLVQLTSLELGHARQRYSQHSSVARLTPGTWERLLQASGLPHLRHLSVPVLFHPEDEDPNSQVSILDYEDILNVFKVFPKLETAMLHRRLYRRNGEQPNFPIIAESPACRDQYRQFGLINVMDF